MNVGGLHLLIVLEMVARFLFKVRNGSRAVPKRSLAFYVEWKGEKEAKSMNIDCYKPNCNGYQQFLEFFLNGFLSLL